MSCKYCELKMRPIDDATKVVLKGESWKDEYGEHGYIGQMYDDKFRMAVSYDAGSARTTVDNIKYCPFCGSELTLPKEPLIEDEKARKVFREWADLLGTELFRVNHLCKYGRTIITSTDRVSEPVIELPGYIGEDSEIYTRVELCGEEEECES